MKFLDVPQSGSIAGVTHSHNRAGQYTRNRRAPTQPIGTGRRAFVRGLFASASSGFSGLTAAQQDAWTSFALSHPVTDSLGQSIKLTGHQMYVRITASLVNTGQAASSTPPASTSPPIITPVVPTFSIATGLSVTFAVAGATQFIGFAVSRPMSSARRFNKTFWQPAGTHGYAAGTAGPWTLTTALYAAQFGAPVVGQNVFVRATPLDVGGFNGAAVIVVATVTA